MSKTSIPGSGLLRLHDVLQRIPISRSALYAGVKRGIYPKPVLTGMRSVAWKEEEIEATVLGFKHRQTI